MKTNPFRTTLLAGCTLAAVCSYGQMGKQWDVTFGSDAISGRHCLAADGQGNVYVETLEPIQVNYVSANPRYTYGKIVLDKVSPTGQILWERAVTEPVNGFYSPGGLKLDPQGNIYCAAVVFNYDGRGDVAELAIAQFSPSGTMNWFLPRCGPTVVKNIAFDVDSHGNTIIVASQGPQPPPFYSTSIVKLDSAGKVTWTKIFRNTELGTTPNNSDVPTGLALDSGDNIYVFSSTTGNAGSDQQYPALVKFSAAGDFIWSQKVASPKSSTSDTVRMGPNGDLYCSTLSETSASISRLTALGVTVWTRTLSLPVRLMDLTVDANGGPSLLCYTPVDTPTPDSPLFVFHFNASGSAGWIKTVSKFKPYTLVPAMPTVAGMPNGDVLLTLFEQSTQTGTSHVLSSSGAIQPSLIFPPITGAVPYDSLVVGTALYVVGNRFDLPGGPNYLVKFDVPVPAVKH